MCHGVAQMITIEIQTYEIQWFKTVSLLSLFKNMI